jgi:flavin reductase (DIM6/NTAB) family NADH-FMN oxidoreductase RutF
VPVREVGDPVDPLEYRRVAGRFATGVTVVSTVHRDVAYAITVSSFTSVSLTPLLVLFCVERVARFHEPVVAAGSWAVSVLGTDQEPAARWFATRGRPLEGQFAGYPTRPGPVTGAPVLEGAIAVLECRTTATYPGGDHTVVLGEVLHAAAPAGPAAGPLLYVDGDYRRLPD